MFLEASIYTLKQLPVAERCAYGVRILTTRRWLRGVCWNDLDLWIPTAGPSLPLLATHREGLVSWAEFLAHYTQEQGEQERCRIVSRTGNHSHSQWYATASLEQLRRLGQQHSTITLLCWESTQQCHRYHLKQMLEYPDFSLL